MAISMLLRFWGEYKAKPVNGQFKAVWPDKFTANRNGANSILQEILVDPLDVKYLNIATMSEPNLDSEHKENSLGPLQNEGQ